MTTNVTLPTLNGDRIFAFGGGDGITTPLVPLVGEGAATETTLENFSAKFLQVDADTSGTEQLVPGFALILPGSGGGVVGGTVANPLVVRQKAVSAGFDTATTDSINGTLFKPLPTIAATECVIRNANNAITIEVAYVAAPTKVFPIFPESDSPPLEGITNLDQLQIRRSDLNVAAATVYLSYVTRE